MKAKFENSDGSIFEVDGLPDGVYTPAPTPTTSPAPSPSPSPSPSGAATVSGTFADGSTFNVSVPPGTRQHIVAGDDSKGRIWHTTDGAVYIGNDYFTAPGDLTLKGVTVTAPDGSQLFSGDLTIWQWTHTRPWRYKARTKIASPDLTKFATLAGGASGDMTAKYAASDNGPMGRGFYISAIGAGGENPHLGEPFPQPDAVWMQNPTAANLEVMLGMAESSAVWPFHCIDPATEQPIDIATYPKASMEGAMYGRTGNPVAAPNSACPQSLTQAAGHAIMWNVLPCALYDDEIYRDELTQWAQYVGCLWLAPAYRLPSGVAMPTHQASDGSRGEGRSMLAVAYAATYSDRQSQFAAWVSDNVAALWSLLSAQSGIQCWQRQEQSGRSVMTFKPWMQATVVAFCGMAKKLGLTDANLQNCLDYFAGWLFDALLAAPHEFATLYGCAIQDASGNMAPDWATALQDEAALTPAVAAALQQPEDSAALIAALTSNNAQYQAGDFDGYPWSPTGYPSALQPGLAMAVKYATDQTRAQAAWTKFQTHLRADYSSNPKYNVQPD